MAYVGSPFRHDVFVTYSHGDVEGVGESRLKSWSQAFIAELDAELRQNVRFARELALFFDESHRAAQGLDPLSGLTEQLRTEVGGSALLVVLMTPQYLDSKWCGTEREWWREAQEAHALATDGRVAVVRLAAAEPPWPPPLSDAAGEPLVGYWFYDRGQPPMSQRPHAWPRPTSETGGVFRDSLLGLVGDLGARLEEVRQRCAERHRAAKEAAKLSAIGGQTLYLHGRAAQAAAWERAADTLSQSGFTVLPSEPDPVESDLEKIQRLARGRVETLSACDALLLVGAGESREVDADLVVVGRNDRQSARALSNRLLPCALLDTIGAAIATPRRLTAARALQVQWLDGTAESWVPGVQGWLSGSSAQLAPETAPETPSGTPPGARP